MSKYIFIAILPFFLWSCEVDKEVATESKTGYNIEPVDIQNINSAVELSLAQQNFLQHLEVSQLT